MVKTLLGIDMYNINEQHFSFNNEGASKSYQEVIKKTPQGKFISIGYSLFSQDSNTRFDKQKLISLQREGHLQRKTQAQQNTKNKGPDRLRRSIFIC